VTNEPSRRLMLRCASLLPRKHCQQTGNPHTSGMQMHLTLCNACLASQPSRYIYPLLVCCGTCLLYPYQSTRARYPLFPRPLPGSFPFDHLICNLPPILSLWWFFILTRIHLIAQHISFTVSDDREPAQPARPDFSASLRNRNGFKRTKSP
jgi:hypothetical protein